MSNFDLGQGVANVGNIWANKIQQDRAEEDQKRLEAQALARLGIEQQRLQMDKDQQAQAHAAALFKQVMQLQEANPGGLVPTAAIPKGIDPLTRATVFSNVQTPQAKQFAGAMQPMGGDQSQSQMNVQDVAPQDTGMSRINTPFNTKLAVAQVEGQNKTNALNQQWELAQQKNALTSALASAKDDLERSKIQGQLDMLNQRMNNQMELQGPRQTLSMANSYRAATKTEETAFSALDQIRQGVAALKDPNNPNRTGAQMAIVEGVNRLNNPGSIVRAQTMNMTVGHQSLPDAISGWFQQLQNGGFNMSDESSKQLAAIGDAVGQHFVKTYKQKRQQYQDMIDSAPYTINPKAVMGDDLSLGITPTTTAPAPATAPATSTPLKVSSIVPITK